MNRYINAMEIGNANEKDGITYFELVNQLEKIMGYKFDSNSESTFYYWFVDNFSTYNNEIKLNSRWKADFHSYLNKKHQFSRLDIDIQNKGHQMEINFKLIQWFLNGEASKQYLDYIELSESRIAATDARQKSIVSIRIAVAALLASAILGIYSIYPNPKTPYDVRII